MLSPPKNTKSYKNIDHFNCEKIVELQKSAPECSIMTEGYNPTKRIFYFCLCDPDCQNPICEKCVKICHANHWINKNLNELISEERNSICHCGQMNHVIVEGDNEKDFFYKEECLFMEWSLTSKTYEYYENSNNDKVCPFCYNRCVKNKNEYQINHFENNDPIPKCKCNQHSDFNKILEKFAKVFQVGFEFEKLSINQFIQMVLLSEESLKNSFYNITENISKIRGVINNPEFALETYANNNHLIKALEKIEFMLYTCKNLYYFKNPKLDCFDFIYQLIEEKENSNFSNLFPLKRYLFGIYHKISFRSDFEQLPTITERDVYNLNPFQRLMYCDYFKKFTFADKYLGNDNNKNIIDNLLQIIKTCRNLKHKSELTYEILRIVYAELKRFIRFNLLTHEQSVKFFTLNDDLIYSSVSSKDTNQRTENAQIAMLNQMVKCVLYLSYYYNDNLLMKYFNSDISLSDTAFFHCDNEFAKLIYKNVTHILFYCNLISNSSQNMVAGSAVKTTISPKPLKFLRSLGKSTHYRDQIMFIATNITSLTLNPIDSYQIGMKRLFSKNKSFYLNYLNNIYTAREKEIIERLNHLCMDLEKIYTDFFQYVSNPEMLQNDVIRIINEVFSVFERGDYKIPYIRKGGEKKKFKYKPTMTLLTLKSAKTRNIELEAEKREIEERRKILLNKTPITFSIMKSLTILIKCTKNDNDFKTIEQNYFDALFKYLFFYVEKDQDNCIMVLSKNIMTCFHEMPILNLEQLLNFLIYVCRFLLRKDTELNNTSYLMKVLKNITERTSGKSEYIQVLDGLIRCVSKLSKMKFLNEEHITNKLRKYVKYIYYQNTILAEYKDMLADLSSKNETLSNLIEQKELLNGYPIETLTVIYKNFLKVMNILYNENSAIKEATYLSTVFPKIQIQKILVDLNLPFNLRIEILKFFRIAYINMKIDILKLQEYISIVINSESNSSDYAQSSFNFFHNLLNVKDTDSNMVIESYVLTYELKNFSKIVEEVASRRKLYQYFEEGIIIPSFVFINKYMSIIYSFDGNLYLKLYEIVLYFLEVKKALISKNSNKGENEKYFFSNLFLNMINSQKNKFSVIFANMDQSTLQELELDITELKSENFKIFDYHKVFSFFDKHVKSFIKKPESKFLKELFTKKTIQYTDEEIAEKLKEYKKNGVICSPFTEKIFELLMKYENDKLNFEEGSLSFNLGEKNILYDATYRSIILRPMFFLINNQKLYYKYRIQNLWHIFRLLQCDTGGTQEDILDIYKSDRKNRLKTQTININYLCNLFIESYLSIIFSGCNPNASSSSDDYRIAYMVIKILKYLCEDHNINFQTLFFKEIKIDYEQGPLNLFELMMCTLDKVVLLAQWDTVGFNQVEDNITYYYEIFFVMVEFAIEMIQGTSKSNLTQIMSNQGRENENSYFYKFMKDVKSIITNDNNDSEIVYNVRLDLINFIVAFLEEKKTPEKLIIIIGNLFNPLTIFNSILKTLKKLYIKYSESGDITDYEQIEFDKKKYKYFIGKYFEDSEFSQCNEFELSNRMYNYVKLLTNFGNKDAKLLIDSIQLYEETDLEEISNQNNELKGKDDENVLIDQNFTQNFYAVKFFESITKQVWVQGEDPKPQMVLFTLDPTVMCLSQDTKTIFFENVPRDNRASKLFALMEYCNYFFIEINHNKKRLKGNLFLKWLNALNFNNVQACLFSLNALTNIIIVSKANNKNAYKHYKDIYDIVLPLGIIQVILNSMFFLFWVLSKFSLYFLLEKEKYYVSHKLDKEEYNLSFIETFNIAFFNTLFSKKEIISFIWNIIFSTLGFSHKKHMFFFSVQLLIIVNLSPILLNVCKAVSMRYVELITFFFFLILTIYVCAVIAFYFLSKDYIKDLEDNLENACGSLIYCFLTHVNYGLRTDGGIGEFIAKVSYLNDSSYFMGMFFFQLMFFIIIILILLAVIGGTIIDSFSELTNKLRDNEIDMKNVCFICNGDRNSIENNGENFDLHIKEIHDVWTYVDYMIALKFVDPQETNAINSFVIEKLGEKKTSWFPAFNYDEDGDEDGGDDNDEDED